MHTLLSKSPFPAEYSGNSLQKRRKIKELDIIREKLKLGCNCTLNGHIAFAKQVNCLQQIPYWSFTTNILLLKERSKPFDPKSVNDGETAPQYITRVKKNVRYRPHADLPWYTHTHIPNHASRGRTWER